MVIRGGHPSIKCTDFTREGFPGPVRTRPSISPALFSPKLPPSISSCALASSQASPECVGAETCLTRSPPGCHRQPACSHFSLAPGATAPVGPGILPSPEVSHRHVMCPSEYQVSPTLEPPAPDFVLWGWAVWGRRRFHPSTRDGSSTNAEFIEVVKQSVDNMDSVFLINTAIPRETANCGEVSKTQQRFPRLSNFGP